ncbi:MAG: hypothetical protein AAGF01_01590 [Cyanobacteria bacterium P01_G01_bin.38]
MAQVIAEPVVVLSVPAEPAEVVEGMSVAHSIIDQEQAIVEADGKPSDKLRHLAQLHGVPRSSKGKRRRCDVLRADLKPLVSVALP